MEYRLCPSILSADFNRLGEQIKILEKEGVEYLHIDVTVSYTHLDVYKRQAGYLLG